MTIWWCMAVVNHHRLFKNALKVVSFEFAGFALNSPIRRIQGRIGKWCFRNPKNESEQILWLGWLLESAFGTADHREIAELLSHRRNTWFESGVFSDFFSKNSWFFWKICRWENQENHIKKCFCDEIKKGAASQTHLGHLASSGRFLRTRVAPKSQFAESANWETAQKSHQFWLSEFQK